ncbi:MAG: PqqD family protein [Planctomycetes bacterium]|nr:PqqD family protein [Planctomycetota bacterium]
MRFADHVKWRSEKFGAVVFDTLNERVYVTNETGKEILRLLSEGCEAPAIVESLREGYEGDPGQIDREVSEFLGGLRSAGFLETASERA